MRGSENSRIRTESSKVRIGEKCKVMKWRRASNEVEKGKYGSGEGQVWKWKMVSIEVENGK